MRKTLLLLCSTLLLIAAAGCSSSSSSARMVDFYRAPGTVSFVFDKGAALALNGGPEMRAMFEDTIVTESGSRRLVAAHTVLSADDLRSAEFVKQRLLEKGFDGLLTMRAIRATEVNPMESVQGETLTSYAGSVPPGEPAFGEGRMRIEARIFRLSDEALVWGGIAEVNATDPQTVVRDAVKVLLKELRAKGLVHD